MLQSLHFLCSRCAVHLITKRSLSQPRLPKGFDKYFKNKPPTQSNAKVPLKTESKVNPGAEAKIKENVESQKDKSRSSKEEPQASKEDSKSSKSETKQGNKQDDWKSFKFEYDSFQNMNNMKNEHFFAIGACITFGVVYFLNKTSSYREITWKEFTLNFLKANIVSQLEVINKQWVRVVLNPGIETTSGTIWMAIGSVESFERSLRSFEESANIPPEERINIVYKRELEMSWENLFKTVPYIILPLFALGMLTSFLRQQKGGAGSKGIFGFSKSTVKVMEKGTTTIRFKDVAGCDEAKTEIIEFVNFLRHPQRYKALGAKIPRGAILKGPPGTGKTLLAKATAGEADVPFLSVSGSEFQEMFVGVGSSRVRDMFKQARKKAPCILFIDEVDAIGRKRSNKSMGSSEYDNTLNQLLVEMDGFSTDQNVVVLAATNRADILDSALMRPGRFDRQIFVALPDIKGRSSIFRVHLGPLLLANELDPVDISKRLAARTPGFSGADIANVCNEAALIAARDNAPNIVWKHFEAAVDRVIGGLEKKTRVLSPDDKKSVSVHEAGHAVAGWFLEHCAPLLKVSIIPRGEALGYAQYQPKDIYMSTPLMMHHQMILTLGGRAAEQVFYGNFSSGAMDDLSKVTQSAYGQVVQMGFSTKIGHMNYGYRGREESIHKPYSEATAQMIDEEARQLVNDAWEAAVKLIKEKKSLVQAVADRLLEKESVDKQDMIELLGERPFKEKVTYDELTADTGPDADLELPAGLKDWNKPAPDDPKT